MDLKTFALTISQIAEEKGISEERVIETVETALAAAYKKEYGKRGQIVKAKFDPITGEVKFWQVKIVVDASMLKPEEEGEDGEAGEAEEGVQGSLKEGTAGTPSGEDPREAKQNEEAQAEEEEIPIGEELGEKKIKFNPEKHLMIEEAKTANPDVKIGDEVTYPLETKLEFGRIAAQTAKQVIIQQIREAEKESIFSEYKSKEGEILSGIIQRVEGRNVFVDIGKTTGLLLFSEQIPGETYRIGQRLKVFLFRVEEGPRGTVVLLSRAYPKMLSKLFELEVPEVASGTVVIKSIAREPGSRSKIAVASKEEGVDPIGSCVGQKGTRVNAVIGELNGEKIDIIEWNEDDAQYVAKALSPAKVAHVDVNRERGQAVAYVAEDQLSLAIGRVGQNVRLAAKLTGWKIDVRPYYPDQQEEKRETATAGEEGKEKEEEHESVQAMKEAQHGKQDKKENKETKKKKVKTENNEEEEKQKEGA